MCYIRIFNLRVDHDLTQMQIAKVLNISQRAYSHYENGTRQIPLEVLVDLSLFYNVSVDYLLGVTDSRRTLPRTVLAELRRKKLVKY